MNEGDFLEGGALNTFGEKYNYEGKEFDVKMKYSVLGTSINYLLDNEILDIPDYIKIDVDGLEIIHVSEFKNNELVDILLKYV